MKLTRLGGTQNDGLFRHPKTLTIYFRKYREGKGEICKSTRTSDVGTARKRRDAFMQELWGDRPKVARRQTVGEIWKSWAQGLRNTKSKGTAVSIDASWKHLSPYISDKFLDELTEEWWLNTYIPLKRAEIANEETGETRLNRKFFNDRKWLSMFLLWCERNRKADGSWRRPLLKNPDPRRNSGKVYSSEETERLINVANWTLAIQIIMGLEHFMRRSEIALLEKSWIDRKKQIICLPAHATKIRRERKFPYNARLELGFKILDEAQEEAGIESKYVFPSPSDPSKSIGREGFRTAWENARRKAGVSGRFHDLRHTGLTRAFKKKGANPALICFFAGLSLAEAQQTYLHFSIDDMRGVENLVESN